MRIQVLASLLLALPATLLADKDYDLLVDAEISRGVLGSNGIQWTVQATNTENGSTQNFTLVVKSQGTNALAEITAPSDSAGSKYLLSDGDMWFYRAGNKRAVSVPRRNRVAGDAAIGDIASTSFLMEYEITGTEKGSYGGESCTVFTMEQKRGARPAYSRIKLWVSNSARVIRQAHFFTPSGKHIRTAEYQHSNSITVSGRSVPFISRLEVTDLLGTPKKTVLRFTNYRITSFPSGIFDKKDMADS